MASSHPAMSAPRSAKCSENRFEPPMPQRSAIVKRWATPHHHPRSLRCSGHDCAQKPPPWATTSWPTTLNAGHERCLDSWSSRPSPATTGNGCPSSSSIASPTTTPGAMIPSMSRLSSEESPSSTPSTRSPLRRSSASTPTPVPSPGPGPPLPTIGSTVTPSHPNDSGVRSQTRTRLITWRVERSPGDPRLFLQESRLAMSANPLDSL
ncbi:MAG: hypothetical protein QG671_2228 [Actinomycetota bacterium]|nr:hypothetical protein [Actinomycetota bacterium]